MKSMRDIERERKIIEKRYRDSGVPDFTLKNKYDLIACHGINPINVKGFDGLSESDKQLFEDFLISFYNAQGLDRRSVMHPASINRVTTGSETYLRYDQTIIQNDYSLKNEWYHVITPSTWY